VPTETKYVTAGVLITIAGLHMAWGIGSSFPFHDRVELADAVVGTQEGPTPAACFAVAAALVVAGALVLGLPRLPPYLRRLGLSVWLAFSGYAGPWAWRA
jgi:hypothetical protein